MSGTKHENPDPWGIVRPVVACGHINPHDGLCAHPANMTPECHVTACPLGKQRCPMPDCESPDQRVIERRPDGRPRYECEDCATVWSHPDGVVMA